MRKRDDIKLAIGLLVVFAGCSSNPMTDDQNFESKRSAEIIPIPVDVDTDLTKVFIKKPGAPNPDAPVAAASPAPAPSGVPGATPVAAVTPVPSAVPSPVAAVPPPANPPRRTPSSTGSGGKDRGTVTYRVKPFDTLMKISFEVLGDLRRWREIAEQNAGKIGKLNSLSPGTVLTIRATSAIDVERNGDPYLIRRRDTLIKISDHLYGTPRKWWALWDNNRQLIHDPNRIYAGFTLYYHPDLTKRSFTEQPVPAKAEEAPAPAVAENPPAKAEPKETIPVEMAPDVARAPAANQAPAISSPALAPSEVPETAPASPGDAPAAAESAPVSGA